MLTFLLDSLLLNRLPKVQRELVMELVFYAMQGVFAGIGLNDLYRIFNLPGNDQPSPIPNVRIDELYQYGAAGLVALSGATGVLPLPIGEKNNKHKWLNNITLGTGMVIGSYIASLSEHKSYIGFVQHDRDNKGVVTA